MTPLYLRQMESADLKRLHRVKVQPPEESGALGPAMLEWFDRSIARRETKLSKIIEVWIALVPETLNTHCALQSYVRGTLTVIVDSGSHLYELKQLLLAGLQQQILLAGRGSGLRKINLKAGRWDDEPRRDPRRR